MSHSFQTLTTTKPSKCGFYFIEAQSYLTGKKFIGVAKLYNNKGWNPDPNEPPNTVFWDGENMKLTDDRIRILRYSASPIPEPIL